MDDYYKTCLCLHLSYDAFCSDDSDKVEPHDVFRCCAAPVATDKKGEKAASQRHSASPNARVTESKRRKQDKEPVSTENHAANAAEQMQNVVCKSVSPTARTEGNGKKKKKRKLQDVGTPKEHPSTDSGGAGGEAIVGKKKRKRSNPTAVAEATQAGDQSKDAEPQLKAVSDGSPGSKYAFTPDSFFVQFFLQIELLSTVCSIRRLPCGKSSLPMQCSFFIQLQAQSKAEACNKVHKHDLMQCCRPLCSAHI